MTARTRVDEWITGDKEFILARDPKKVMVAFLAGIQYHDALMAYSKNNPSKRESYVTSEELNHAFEVWHEAIAIALGETP